MSTPPGSKSLLFLKKKKQKDFYLFAVSLAIFIFNEAAAEPALKHVVLSSGGVGLFAFEAQASGAATLRLSVKLDQVDDILKSLTVTDPAGPMVSLRLAGREPLAESFKTLPFQPGDFASAEALLGALVGEQIRIPLTGASGSILAVSSFQQGGPTQPSVERHRLTIATQQGIDTVVLEDTPTIEFASEKRRTQVAAALSAIAAQRVQDERTLDITLAEGGQRTVQIAYVVQAPVWKTSYRITLPPEGDNAPAHLQAYAVIENLSGLDWKNVDVDLTSGRPALFHTPLYQALFLNRPEAPVDLPGVVAPPPDRSGPAMASALMAPAPAPPPAFAPMQRNAMMPRTAHASPQFQAGAASYAKAEPEPSDIQTSVAQVDFHLASPITATSGQTLLVPIIDRQLPAERIALFNAATDANHPLVALRITNNSAGALPPGVITLYQAHTNGEAYIGDSRIATIEPGETRYASFAADLQVSVSHDLTQHTDLVAVKAANGSLSLTRQSFTTTAFTITTPKSAGRKLVLETPREPNATVTEPGTGVTLTDTSVRVSTDLPPATTRTIRVTQKTQNTQVQTLTPDDITDFAYLATSGDVPKPIRDAIHRAQDLRAAVDKQQQTLDRLHNEEDEIVKDQSRIRDNLQAVPPNSDLQRRYLATLSTQETRLSALRDQESQAQSTLESAQKTLADYLASLTL